MVTKMTIEAHSKETNVYLTEKRCRVKVAITGRIKCLFHENRRRGVKFFFFYKAPKNTPRYCAESQS
jgi:hypothetical protein